jgi:hypothetical protein
MFHVHASRHPIPICSFRLLTCPQCQHLHIPPSGRNSSASPWSLPPSSHPVGGRWNSSNQTTTYRIVMPALSDLALEVLESNGFTQMCWRAIRDTKDFLKSRATDQWTNVPISINDSRINFAESDPRSDVHGSLGQCTFVGTLIVSIRRNALGSFDVGKVSCSGDFNDLYDWSYWAQDIGGGFIGSPQNYSRVQAGHATLAPSIYPEAGRVFFTQVKIDASSAKTVGDLGLWEVTQVVVEGYF